MDHDSGLAIEPVRRDQWTLAVDQRQPYHLAIVVETRSKQRAFVEQITVSGAVVGIPSLGCYKLVDVLKAFVVATVEDHAAVLGDEMSGALVLEAAHGGTFHWPGVDVVG